MRSAAALCALSPLFFAQAALCQSDLPATVLLCGPLLLAKLSFGLLILPLLMIADLALLARRQGPPPGRSTARPKAYDAAFITGF